MDLSCNKLEYDGKSFKGITLLNDQQDHKVFTSCTFAKCSFRETVFSNCEFNDCLFRDCDLSLVVLKECVFKKTVFEDCQIVGVNWMDTNLIQAKHVFEKPVDFIKCVLNHSVFMGLNLKSVKLTGCVARDVSFDEADLSQADCTFTDFKDSRFNHSNLSEADFTGATNYSISPGFNTLQKTRFSLPEAMALLHGLDIVLTDYLSDEVD